MKKQTIDSTIEPRVDAIEAKREANAGLKIVTLNFDGKKFQLLQTSFEQLSIYFRVVASAVKVIEKDHTVEYFIENHDYSSFVSIIYYLRNNELHLPKDVCMNIFKREMLFWGINDDYLKTCCFVPYAKYFHEQHAAKKFRKELYRSDIDKAAKTMSPWKGFLWRMMNKPCSSVWAGVNQLLTIAATLYLVINMVLKVDEELEKDLEVRNWSEFYENDMGELHKLCKNTHESMTKLLFDVCRDNLFALRDFDSNFNLQPSATTSNPKGIKHLPHNAWLLPTWDWGDMICLFYFLILYIVTLIVSPNKKEFLTNFYGIMWLLTVVTSVVAIITREVYPRYKYQFNLIEGLSYVTRMILLFGLAKNSIYFRVLTYSISKCIIDIVVLIVFFLMSCAVFAVFTHGLEHKDDIHINEKVDDDIHISGHNDDAKSDAQEVDRHKLITTFDSYWATLGIMTTNPFEYIPSNKSAHILAGFLTIAGILFVSVSIPIFQEEFGFYLSIFKNEELIKKTRRKEAEMLRKKMEEHSQHSRGHFFRGFWHNVVLRSERHSDKTRSNYAPSRARSESSSFAKVDSEKTRLSVDQLDNVNNFVSALKIHPSHESFQHMSIKISERSHIPPIMKKNKKPTAETRSSLSSSLKSATSKRIF